jgi:hypothetical protein
MTKQNLSKVNTRVEYCPLVRERVMTLFKITKLIHDKTGIFINPIDLKPKMIYLTIKAKLERGRG